MSPSRGDPTQGWTLMSPGDRGPCPAKLDLPAQLFQAHRASSLCMSYCCIFAQMMLPHAFNGHLWPQKILKAARTATDALMLVSQRNKYSKLSIIFQTRILHCVSNQTPSSFQKTSSLPSTLQNSKGYTIKCEKLQHKLSTSLLSPTNTGIFVMSKKAKQPARTAIIN